MRNYNDFKNTIYTLTGNKLARYNTALKTLNISSFDSESLEIIKKEITEEQTKKGPFDTSKHIKPIAIISLLTGVIGGMISYNLGTLAHLIYLGLGSLTVFYTIKYLNTNRFLVNSKKDITEAEESINKINTTLKNRKAMSRAVDIDFTEIEKTKNYVSEEKKEKKYQQQFSETIILIEELLSKIPTDKAYSYRVQITSILDEHIKTKTNAEDMLSKLLNIADELIEILDIDPTSLEYGYILSRNK